jgi:chemotaxis protein CheX
MTDQLTLPDRLDSSGAAPLARELLSRRGKPLVLDAAGVEVIGALAFEVIVAAGRQWDADGVQLNIEQPSDRYLAAAQALGLKPDAPWRVVAAEGTRGMET